ncbi:hypothetical protein Tco_0656137 [Tanacetum coccineum]|uniref:Uncharacterized protein n=1 Tax=Tanacetum coccineum TaxID=301880 RepID=A0ABQ4X8F9_9ASTR
MSLSEYYHECNSLWRQFDSLVDIPGCTCEGSPKLKKHAQLLRLMQFLMGLDDVFSSVRSSICTTDPISNVKYDFATLSTDKCFELEGYPPEFKKGNKTQNNVNNVFVCDNNKTDHGKSNTHTLTSDQYERLMSLLSSTSDASKVSVSITAHPNGTVAQVTQIGRFKIGNNLIIKDVLVLPEYHVSLLFVHKLSKDNNVVVSFNESMCKIQDSTQRLPTVVLSGRSPYELIYQFEPSLLHLKTFGCIYFSTMLNESDKFSARSFTKEFIFEENGITDLNFFDEISISSPKSCEPNDEGGDIVVDGNETATNNIGTQSPNVSTVDGAAKTKDTAGPISNTDNAVTVGSTSSRKDLGTD